MSYKSYAFIHDFLSENHYFIDKDEVNLKLNSHPDYPNLTAVSDTLAMLGVESILAQVPKEFFDQLPEKFISIILPEPNNPEVVLVHRINNDQVLVTFPDDTQKTYSTPDFLDQWLEILLSVSENKTHKSPTSSNIKSRIKFREVTGIMSVLAVLVFLLSRSSYIDGYSLSYAIVSLLGLAISILLVRESLGINSGKLSNICHASFQTDCGDIILSKGAELFKGVLLSDLCIIYFTSTLALSFGYQLYLYETLLYLGLFAIIPVIYSIYYQAFVLKKWCFLCLCIAGILILQLVSVSLTPVYVELNLSSISITFFMLTLFAFLWTTIKPSFEKLLKSNSTQLRFHALKRELPSFQFLLDQRKELVTDELHPNTIQLGDINAKTKITGILSPTCSSCGDTYQSYLQLITRHPEVFHIKLIFNVNIDQIDKNTQYIPLVARFHEIYQTQRSSELTEALSDWYIKQIGLKKWNAKWGLNKNDVNDLLRQNLEWCSRNGINHSPETLINEKLIPIGYDVNDLSYFIEFLKN